MKRLLAALTGVALLALPAGAAAAVDITSVNAGDYPRTQATVVTAKPTQAAAGIDGERAPATGLVADEPRRREERRAARRPLAVDEGRGAEERDRRRAGVRRRQGPERQIAVIAFGHKAV